MGSIECYHKQRKIGKGLKLWILLAVFILILIVYFFSSDKQIPKKSNTSVIIIKEPETDKIKINHSHIDIKASIIKPRVGEYKVLENLDEVNQIYKK